MSREGWIRSERSWGKGVNLNKIHCLEFSKNRERWKGMKNQTVMTWAEQMAYAAPA